MVAKPSGSLARMPASPVSAMVLAFAQAVLGVALADRQALHLVGVEQFRAGQTTEHGMQLPREVVCISDAGAHPHSPVGGIVWAADDDWQRSGG